MERLITARSASHRASRVRVKVYERGYELNLGVGLGKDGKTSRATAVLTLSQAEEVLAAMREGIELARLNTGGFE